MRFYWKRHFTFFVVFIMIGLCFLSFNDFTYEHAAKKLMEYKSVVKDSSTVSDGSLYFFSGLDIRHNHMKYLSYDICQNRSYISPIKAHQQYFEWEVEFSKEIHKKGMLNKSYIDKPMFVKLPKIKTSMIPFQKKNDINISCSKLFKSDPLYSIEVELKMHKLTHKIFPKDEEIILDTWNCKKFIKNNGYITETITKEEADFPLAFSIMTYKDASQVEQLLRATYRPQNYFCIHVDTKSNVIFKAAIKGIAKCFDNVFLSSTSLPVYWGHISLLNAELVCLNDLVRIAKNNGKKWKYLINLTGQEFPLKTNWEIINILKAHNGAVLAGVTRSSFWKFRWDSSYAYKIQGKELLRARRGPKGHPPHQYRFAKGSTHIALPFYFAEYVIQSKIAKDLKLWLNDTAIPDETFFATLVSSGNLGVPGAYKGEIVESSCIEL